MTTPLWTKNISILYEKRYLFEVIPDKNFDFNRKLNSLLRLSIYYSGIVFLLDNKKTNIFYIPFVVGILTHILSLKYNETFINQTTVDLMNDKVKGDLANSELIQGLNKVCNTPTKDNPFMNLTIKEFNTEKATEEPCDSYNNKGIQRQIDKLFNDGLYRDVNDIFGKQNSQRQFYTVPGNNDQGTFAKWLYGTPPTCKEGNGQQCASNQYGGGGGGTMPSS